MYAVTVAVTVNDGEAAISHLRETIVPRVSQAPGFVAGYWVRLGSGDGGRSVIVCESEDAARDIASHIQADENEAVTMESVDVGEVVASA